MSGVDWWEVDEAIRKARVAQGEASDAYDAQLQALLVEYAGKRSAAAKMVRQVAELAVGYAAEAQRRADGQVHAVRSGVQAGTERLEERAETYRKRNEQLERALSEKRTIREEREASRQDGDTDVTISNGHFGWTVAGLEEIAYRLRCGGAEDDTPVEVDKARAKASVPAPNLVTLEHRPTPPAVRPPSLPDPVVPDPGLRIDWRLAVALLVVVLSVVAGVVVFG